MGTHPRFLSCSWRYQNERDWDQTKEVVANVYDYSSTGIHIRKWMIDATTMNKLALLNRGTFTFIEWWETTVNRIGQLFTSMKLSLLRFFQNHSGFRSGLNCLQTTLWGNNVNAGTYTKMNTRDITVYFWKCVLNQCLSWLHWMVKSLQLKVALGTVHIALPMFFLSNKKAASPLTISSKTTKVF